MDQKMVRIGHLGICFIGADERRVSMSVNTDYAHVHVFPTPAEAQELAQALIEAANLGDPKPEPTATVTYRKAKGWDWLLATKEEPT